MTMPKKGVRKMVVGGRTYKYVIKPFSIGSQYSGHVTIESADGKDYIRRHFNDIMTPQQVREIIEEHEMRMMVC
jgi:hypothetical protein